MIPVFVRLQWQLHRQWFFFAAGAATLYSVDNLFFRKCRNFLYNIGLIRHDAMIASVDGFNGYSKWNRKD
jgi:hypothetical protein